MVTAGSGQQSLRRGRVSIPGHYYHVTCATIDRAHRFLDWPTGLPVIAALRTAQHTGAAMTLAYCLMPDHLHWVLCLGPRTLAEVVGQMKGRAARSAAGAGRLWQRGYYDHAIRTDENLLNVARYIVANPLRAGLVDRIGDYPLWDSVWLP